MSSSFPGVVRIYVDANEARQMCNRRMRIARSAQAGVGLIEVLVAVVVLSIAFLGIAALQAMSLSTNNSAMARSMATIDSYSILDAMRADKVSAVAGSYNTSSPLAGNACPASGTTLASVQLNEWCTRLSKDLGASASTTGAIACTASGTAGTDGTCAITITFDDSRAGANGSGSSVQTVVTEAML